MSTPKTIDVTELILRDAHQSLMATRMATEDMLPACEDLDNAGFWSLECWGGATFDACIRFLNEDPWERLRTFKKLMPKTPLQMLLRGQNLVGYRHYDDDVVERFVDKAAENGMDVFRVFDALNDIRNFEHGHRGRQGTGKHAQGTICYTISPVHTIDDFVDDGRAAASTWAADSICIKDMAALLKPQPAYDLVHGDQGRVRRGRPRPRARARDHRRHAGQPDEGDRGRRRLRGHRDQLDEPRAGPQPDREPGRDARGHRLYTTALDMARLLRDQGAFRQDPAALRRVPDRHHRRRDGDLQEPDPGRHDLEHGEPAEAAGRRRPDATRCWPRCRRSARTPAIPPLVTPSSQIVGTQAVFNVLMGRYKVLTGEFADLMLGYYGSTLGEREPGGGRTGRQAGEEGADHRAVPPTC